MIEMTWIPEFVRGGTWVYLLVWLGLTLAAVLIPATIKKKISSTLFVTVVFGALPAYFALSIKNHNDEQRPVVEQHNTQLQAAMARFEDRCKTARESIYKTVEDVDGIFVIKVIPPKPAGADVDAMWPEAGIIDRTGEDYLMSFLRNTELYPEYRDGLGRPLHQGSIGYRFVDANDEATGERFRYSAPHIKNGLNPTDLIQKLSKKFTNGPIPKFGVTYEAFVEPEDRKSWIAGGAIRVIDIERNEVIAEKIGYVIDPGQGSTAGFRSPWAWAHSYGKRCPADWGQGTTSRNFVDKVLKQKKGE